jgi:hypothetical protein
MAVTARSPVTLAVVSRMSGKVKTAISKVSISNGAPSAAKIGP